MKRVTVSAVIVFIAAIAIGYAIAAIPAADGTIHGCYKNNGGALRIIDPSISSCASSETALDWNGPGTLTDYTIVVRGASGASYPISVDPGETRQATAYCPDGSVVTGGGYDANYNWVRTYGSHPIADSGTFGWETEVINVGTVTAYVQVWAICAKASSFVFDND